MTRKEFKETPERKWDEVLHGVRAVWVMPNGKKHDSGWGCFDFVAEFGDNRRTSSSAVVVTRSNLSEIALLIV